MANNSIDSEQINAIAENGPVFFVGPNNAGKTFCLRHIYNDCLDNSIFIDVDGRMLDSKDKVGQIRYLNGSYYYDSQTSPNLIRKVDVENEIKDVCDFCSDMQHMLSQMHGKEGSSAIRKTQDIFGGLLEIDISMVKAVFIDEPESLLDDANLCNVSKLIRLLVKARIRVFTATHSPRFLQLMSADLGSIIHIDRTHQMHFYSFEMMLAACTQWRDKNLSLESLKSKSKYVRSLYMPNRILEEFLQFALHSEPFYRALFYESVFLLEGPTERAVIQDCQIEDSFSYYFYYTAGKSNVPYLAIVFLTLNKTVSALCDEDGSKWHEANDIISELSVSCGSEHTPKTIRLTFFKPNLEQCLGYEPEEYKKDFYSHIGKNDDEISMPHLGSIKPALALCYLSDNPKKRDEIISKIKELPNASFKDQY